MRKRFHKLHAITALCAALGWWGFLYPEFAITADTVSIVSEEDSTECQTDEEENDQNLYLTLLKAGRSNIRFRSKLLMELNSFLEAHSWENLTKN